MGGAICKDIASGKSDGSSRQTPGCFPCYPFLKSEEAKPKKESLYQPKVLGPNYLPSNAFVDWLTKREHSKDAENTLDLLTEDARKLLRAKNKIAMSVMLTSLSETYAPNEREASYGMLHLGREKLYQMFEDHPSKKIMEERILAGTQFNTDPYRSVVDVLENMESAKHTEDLIFVVIYACEELKRVYRSMQATDEPPKTDVELAPIMAACVVKAKAFRIFLAVNLAAHFGSIRFGGPGARLMTKAVGLLLRTPKP